MTDVQLPHYEGEFIRVVIGSKIHGLNVQATDDLDLMGVRIPRMDETLLLGKPFEQFTWRTQPEGQPSGPGDVDLVVYSLQKYLKLACAGNPTLLNLLFVPPEFRYIDNNVGDELRELTPQIISKQAAERYRGYLHSQRERLLGERGQKRTGYARRLKYYLGTDGWDTKYGMHMVRLGLQGVELMETGKISLPMREPERSQVMSVREGQMSMLEVLRWAEDLESRLWVLAKKADLPKKPDTDRVERWMRARYRHHWTK